MNLFRWLKSNIFLTLLVLIVITLSLKNYTPTTFLIGWDNLMPELNIWLNIKRSILAAWQEYQGLGLVGGMGHASDLIRQLIIAPLALLFPTNTIRYLWQFLMLFVGTLGTFHWTTKTLKFSPWVSFSASLYYLLNFGTIQYFWVAFEPFSTFWGFFPWLVIYFYELINKPSKKSLFHWVLINLLASPSFYVPTVFVVYLICLSAISLPYLFTVSAKKFKITSLIYAFVIVLLINSFWLLPFTYFLKNNSYNPQQAIGNTAATQETFERNQRRGTIADFSLLRGYYFDFPSGNTGLMAPWISYQKNNYILIFGYITTLFIFIGLCDLITKSLSTRKQPIEISLLLTLFIVSIALLSSTPIFSQLNEILRQNSFIDQVFRSPWTKFIVPAIFVFSTLVAFGIDTLNRLFIQLKYSPNFTSFYIFTIFNLSLITFSFPVFSGNFFSPNLRKQIPSEYFELFKFFKNKPSNERIMNLPQGGFWGWTTYNWQTSGSGFLWYAIPQPILDRAFDVWELNNQNYYFELTTAIQKNDPQLLEQIIKKYAVKYVIFDNHVIFPDEKIYVKQSKPTLDMLSQIPELKLVKDIKDIKVFQYQPSSPITYSSSQPTIRTNPYSLGLPINIDPSEVDFRSVIKPSSHSPLIYPLSQFIGNEPSRYLLSTKQSYHLLGFHFDKFAFNKDYFVAIETRNISGHPLTVSAFDDNNHYKFFYTKLPTGTNVKTTWLYLPKMEAENFNEGLTILFNNPSFNSSESTNELISLNIYPAITTRDYRATFLNSTTSSSSSNIFFYKTTSPQNSDKYLTLNQSYSAGWLAFYFDNGKIMFLNNHSTALNWANGWELPSNLPPSTSIYIIFWPQLLEFAGFAFVISTFVWIIKLKK